MLESRRPHFTQDFEAVSFPSARRSASSSHSHTIFARAGPLSSDCLVGRRKATLCAVLQGSRKREGFKQAFSRQHSHRGRASGNCSGTILRSLQQLLVFLLLLFLSFALPLAPLATPAVGRWALLMNGATCLWNSDITVGFDADSLLQRTLFYSCTIIALRRRNVGFALLFFCVCVCVAARSRVPSET